VQPDEEKGIEWQFLLILLILISSVLYYFFTKQVEVSPIHVLYAISGGIVASFIFILTDIKITSIKPANFLFQLGLCNLLLGFPFLYAPPIRLPLKPTQLLLATASESALRITATIWFAYAFLKPFAFIMSSILFTAMHVWWAPQQWLFGILGGSIMTGPYLAYRSETASVTNRFMYDLIAIGIMSPLIYFPLSLAFTITGYYLTRIGGA